MDIHLYNTLTRRKELFVPLSKDEIKLYSCGPTVYGDPHIWNMRAYMFVDILKSTLRSVGWYSVNHVMNITDVGHLTDDGDQWEDKMEKWARRENKTVWEVARMYENNFKKYMSELMISHPDVYTRATEYIQEQIDMVQALTEKWFTYVIEWDGVYMDTSKVQDYGKLAQLDFEWMNSDHRWDGAKIDSSKKRNLSDFALWKISPKDEQRSMEWVYDGDRSWAMVVDDTFNENDFRLKSDYQGDIVFVKRSEVTDEEERLRWFPWRHIECSAMANAELWKHIDIHTWWIDHVTVHHTNEIAQAECSLWCSKWVNRRMHNQFLNIDGWKVSKSKWDDLSIPGIIAKWYDALDLRYFYLTWHYRNFLDFSWEAMESAKKTRSNLAKKISSQVSLEDIKLLDSYVPYPLYKKAEASLADDLDTVSVLTLLHSHAWSSHEDAMDALLLDQVILKIWLIDLVKEVLTQKNVDAPDSIKELAEQRQSAKKAKEYEKADSLREQITNEWRTVKDVSWWYELEPLT